MTKRLFFVFILLVFYTADAVYSQSYKLQISDMSFPKPSIVLNTGSVDEFVYTIKNKTINSKIDSVFFRCTRNPNIIYFPVGPQPSFYITHSQDSVPNSYYTRYTYPYPPHDRLYNLDTVHNNIIDTNMIKTATGKGYLKPGDSIIVHIPYFVKNCSNGAGSNIFFLDSSGRHQDSIPENTYVNVDFGKPFLVAAADTFDNATYCSSVARHTMEVKFKYTNTPSYEEGAPGNARADSLRLYLYWNSGMGTIDTTSIKINGVAIGSSYYQSYTNLGMNIIVIDLTKYPAGKSGSPFGANTIQDLDGSGFADALADNNSFYVSATFRYDSTSCPSFAQCGGIKTFYLPAMYAIYNNQCFSLPYYRHKLLSTDSLSIDASYEYQSASNTGITSVTAPSDVTNNNPAFNIDICPSYSQVRNPGAFNFNCPKSYYYYSIPVPLGFHLNFSSPELSYVAPGANHLSGRYKYVPVLKDSGRCTAPHSYVLNPPILIEHFHSDSTQDTVFVNFGKLPFNYCSNDSELNYLPCMNVPLVMNCGQMPPRYAYSNNSKTISFTMGYSCDTGCIGCSNILSCGTTQTYPHCPGSCSSVPYTDSAWTLQRTTLGYINQGWPHYYTTKCNSSPAVILNPISDSLQNKSLVNLGSAYPGDQIQARINGGYDSLKPGHFANEYVQIRYVRPGFASQPYILQTDPDDSSYFIIHGCVRVPSLNGKKLYLPHCPQNNCNCTSTYTNDTIAMNFSLSQAIQHTYPSLYAMWDTDTYAERIVDSAVINLRVMNGPNYPEYPYFFSCGVNMLNLRAEYMCALPGGYRADTLHSCDSWGNNFKFLEPCPGFGLTASPTSYCDTFSLSFDFKAGNASATYNGTSDFPVEFRPFSELDSVVTIILPKGYVYGSTTFYCDMDNYNNSAADNYFAGGTTRQHFTAVPSISVNASQRTVLTYKGLNNSCWPLIDSKYLNIAQTNPTYILQVNTQPLCSAPSLDTAFYTAGIVVGKQQSDTSFQKHWKITNGYIPIHHTTIFPQMNVPPTTNDSTNTISFKFSICDPSINNIDNAWVAFQNDTNFTLHLASGKLTNITTHKCYSGHLYNAHDTGILFNIGKIVAGPCDTFQFSALIDPNSKSCPAPIGSGKGKLLALYGSNCGDTLKYPDSSHCQPLLDTFYYNVYPTTLRLVNNGFSPDTVSLCGGLLMDSLTIESSNLRSLSNLTFTSYIPTGVTLDSVVFRYPIGGKKDTTIHSFHKLTHSDIVEASGNEGGTIESIGMGEIFGGDFITPSSGRRLDARPVNTDSNEISAKVYMTMSCSYAKKSIQFYIAGASTCNITLIGDTSIVPLTNSACCIEACRNPKDFDVVFNNIHSSTLPANKYIGKHILIEGTFTVDDNFTIGGCNVAVVPGALINIINNSVLSLQNGTGQWGCTHFHASCDTMWRGIFINSGSTLKVSSECLIEDADTAVYAMNGTKQEAVYQLQSSTFNKNYKNIIVRPFNGILASFSSYCRYTCRSYDSLLVSECIGSSNWKQGPPTTLYAPYTGQRSSAGWVIDTVRSFMDGGPSLLSGYNVFENLTTGIISQNTNLTICSDTFQNINTKNYTNAAIVAYGNTSLKVPGDSLVVGNSPNSPYRNIFENCTTGVYATNSFVNMNISYNRFDNSPSTPGTYGIYIAGANAQAAQNILTMEGDTVSNFYNAMQVNMKNYVTANINYNTIADSICYNTTGITVNEVSPGAIYTIDGNTITVLNEGIYTNGLYNPNINFNTINLNNNVICSPSLYSGFGIEAYSCSNSEIACNTVNAPNNINSNTYTGIAESQSQQVSIINNTINYANTQIQFNSFPYAGDNAWDNTLNTGSNGIVATSGAMSGASLGLQSDPSDNTFTSVSCQVNVPSNMTYYYYFTEPFGCSPYIPSYTAMAGNNPCPSEPPFYAQIKAHAALNNHNQKKLDSATMLYMQENAQSKIKYSFLKDTNTVLAKEGVMRLLWGNQSLVNNSIFKKFSDSISKSPIGRIWEIDTSMASNIPAPINYALLLRKLVLIAPNNNIEANIQTAANGYLFYMVNNSLDQRNISLLRTVANKCPDWDGNGVYMARAILSLYDSAGTRYYDYCSEKTFGLNNNSGVVDTTVSNNNVFSVYPNPNRGGFTLSYQLQQGQTAEFIIYTTFGQKVASYVLDANSSKMNILNNSLSSGMYLYNVIVGNTVVKRDKLIIIR